VAEEIECPCCHGSGEMVCHQGCHASPCDVCFETGYVDPETNRDAQRILAEAP
jgi:hypothetical protein